MSTVTLLTADAVVNLVLGVLLLIFPEPLVELLGLPAVENAFYPSILGAVLFGIGLALLIERFKDRTQVTGLGLGGAISINLVGALALVYWLLWGNLAIPTRGVALLWLLVFLLLGLSGLELRTQLRRNQGK